MRKPTIFISYSRKDKPLLLRIASGLSDCGYRIWYDTLEILAGQSVIDRVFSSIRASDIVLVLLTEHSITSNWVKEETEFAKLQQITRRNITIIPLLFEDCDVPPHLQTLNYVDFRTNYQSGFANLVREIKGMVHREALDDLRPGIREFLAALGKEKTLAARSTIAYIDRLFVPPLQFSTIETLLREKHCAFIIGDPHTGKTYTSLYLLWRHFIAGYEPIWLNYDVLSYKFRRQHYDMAALAGEYLRDRTILYIEDPFGSVTPHEIEAFNHGLRRLTVEVASKDVRVIITSRDYVVRQTIEEQFQQYFVYLSSSLKANDSYTDEDIKKITDNYITFYIDQLEPRLVRDNNILRMIHKLAVPHNIEFCIRSLVGVKGLEQARDTVTHAKDIVPHLASYFRRALPEDRLLLIVIGMFSEFAIPCAEKKLILEKCLRQMRLLQVEGDLGVDRFDLLVEKNREYLTDITVKKRYWPRHGGYLLGGPPEIVLASHQLRHPSYWEAISLCLDHDHVFTTLGRGCVTAVLDDALILETTKPLILEPLGQRDEEKALRDIQDNFLLDAAMGTLRTHPTMLNKDISKRLSELLTGCEQEHVLYSVVDGLKQMYHQLPNQLQNAILAVGARHKAEFSMRLVHARIASIIVDHYDVLDQDQKGLAVHSLRSIIKHGSKDAAHVIIGAIRRWLSGEAEINSYLAKAYIDVLEWYTRVENHSARGVLADIWAKRTTNEYPQLESVYRKVRKDPDGFVQDVLRLGLYEADIEWL